MVPRNNNDANEQPIRYMIAAAAFMQEAECAGRAHSILLIRKDRLMNKTTK